MPRCEPNGVSPQAETPNPLPRSWTAIRSRRRKGGSRGDDAGKRVTGRKRHILVDTQGSLLTVRVHPANIQDPAGARLTLYRVKDCLPSLELIWADGGYTGTLIDWVRTVCGWKREIVKRPKGVRSFQALPRRWVVERTFAWLCKFRRLSKDYEALPEASEAWAYGAMVHVLARRLVPFRAAST